MKLLCFDFDGTLAPVGTGAPWELTCAVGQQEAPKREAEQDVELLELLLLLREQQVRWVLNTGRGLDYALQGLEAAGFGQCMPDLMLCREQEIWQPDGQGGWEDFFAWNERKQVLMEHWLKEHQLVLAQISACWQGSGRGIWLADGLDPAALKAHSEQQLESFVPRLRAFAAKHPRLSWQRNSIWLRFLSPELNKGALLRYVASSWQLERGDMFAIGDGYNDMEMLDGAVCAQFACVANTPAALQERVAARGGWVMKRPIAQGIRDALYRLAPLWGLHLPASVR